jgi:hypothetical protein
MRKNNGLVISWRPECKRFSTSASPSSVFSWRKAAYGQTLPSSRHRPFHLPEAEQPLTAPAALTVARFDGFVAKYMGDGVLIYFGYSHADEDDAEQAVRAGLALVDAVGGYKHRSNCGYGLASPPGWWS